MNQGAWYSSKHHLERVVKMHNKRLELLYAGRAASAAPATGYMSLHVEEQNRLVNDALEVEG